MLFQDVYQKKYNEMPKILPTFITIILLIEALYSCSFHAYIKNIKIQLVMVYLYSL